MTLLKCNLCDYTSTKSHEMYNHRVRCTRSEAGLTSFLKCIQSYEFPPVKNEEEAEAEAGMEWLNEIIKPNTDNINENSSTDDAGDILKQGPKDKQPAHDFGNMDKDYFKVCSIVNNLLMAVVKKCDNDKFKVDEDPKFYDDDSREKYFLLKAKYGFLKRKVLSVTDTLSKIVKEVDLKAFPNFENEERMEETEDARTMSDIKMETLEETCEEGANTSTMYDESNLIDYSKQFNEKAPVAINELPKRTSSSSLQYNAKRLLVNKAKMEIKSSSSCDEDKEINFYKTDDDSEELKDPTEIIENSKKTKEKKVQMSTKWKMIEMKMENGKMKRWEMIDGLPHGWKKGIVNNIKEPEVFLSPCGIFFKSREAVLKYLISNDYSLDVIRLFKKQFPMKKLESFKDETMKSIKALRKVGNNGQSDGIFTDEILADLDREKENKTPKVSAEVVSNVTNQVKEILSSQQYPGLYTDTGISGLPNSVRIKFRQPKT